MSKNLTGRVAGVGPAARAALDAIQWDSFRGLSHIHGFNYQPSWGHDARTIWVDGFDEEGYRAELARGKEYFPGFNCVRIWLGYGAYVADREALVRNFHRAIEICTELDLLVIPVLFTVWSGDPPYDPIPLADLVDADFEQQFGNYLREIVTPQRGNASILAWDLCNEPGEKDVLSAPIQAQARWLAFVHDRVKEIDPGARTCIGTIADFFWGQSVAHLCDFFTPHLYGYSLWKGSADSGRTSLEFATWFEAVVDLYLSNLELFNEPKPILSSETCWGSSSDEVRVGVVRDTLGVLRHFGIGFLPHALYTSGVADLHHLGDGSAAYFGSIPNPASMAFIEPDGSLRAGHEIYNDYCRDAT